MIFCHSACQSISTRTLSLLSGHELQIVQIGRVVNAACCHLWLKEYTWHCHCHTMRDACLSNDVRGVWGSSCLRELYKLQVITVDFAGRQSQGPAASSSAL